MNNLTEEQKKSILDSFGKRVIIDVSDLVSEIDIGIAKQTTINPVHLKRYNILSTLSAEQ